ncbi:MAG: SOS response-associated peptidase [Nitrospinaceae bacterium]
MCGRKTLTRDMQSIIEELAVEDWEDPDNYLPSYNIAPTQTSPVLVQNGKRIVRPMRWGLIPYWAKDKSIGSKLINARSETITQKPSFQNLVPRRRCLVIADGYYEWKRESNVKQPYYIHSPEGKLLLMAGLWDTWKDAGAGLLHSYTIITKKSDQAIASLHHRMPVIIPHDAAGTWIQTAKHSSYNALKLLGTATVALDAFAVSTAVNSPAYNKPDCIRPLEPTEDQEADQDNQ